MASKKWTIELDTRLRWLAPDYTYREISVMLGFTQLATKQRARKIGINKIADINFSNSEIEYLKINYATKPSAEIATTLGRTLQSIYHQAKKLSLLKSEAFLKSPASGRLTSESSAGFNSRFKKGNVSPTKGKKQTEFMSVEAIERTKATRFKKGQLPHNTKEDGTITTRKMTPAGDRWRWIRIGVKNWELLNRYNYKKFIGPIPEGMMVAFKDGNNMNCEPYNLYLETVEQHMARNTIHRFDPQLKEVILLLAKYKRKLKSYEKQD
jgi:hypothetical protein